MSDGPKLPRLKPGEYMIVATALNGKRTAVVYRGAHSYDNAWRAVKLWLDDNTV